MKLWDIISSATSNMFRSKVRTGLTILAIFIGAFTITLTVGISSGVTTYLDKQVSNVGAKNVLIIRRKVEVNMSNVLKKYEPDQKSNSAQAALLSAMLNDGDVAKIKTQSDLSNFYAVSAVSPSYISGTNGDKYQVATQPFIDGSQFELITGKLVSGKDTQSEILLPSVMVSGLGFSSNDDAIGKTVEFGIKTPAGVMKTVSAVITGVQQESLITQGGVFVNIPLQTKLLAIQYEGAPVEIAHRYIGVTAEFDSALSKDEVKTIKNSLADKGYLANTVEDQIGIIKQIIDAITYVLIFFGCIALLAASIGIVNTLFMSVQERTKEIGLMKAMGMSRIKVFLLFSVEAMMLGFWGSLLGALAAIGVGRIANNIASDTFLKDLPGFALTDFPVLYVAAIIFVVMLIAFLAGTLPSRRAANQDPIEALRYE